MPQQPSFEPDHQVDFEPDFQPDTTPASSSKYTGVFTGSHPYIEFLPKERVNPQSNPHEMQIVSGVDEGFDKARNYFTDKLAGHPILAGAASLATEPFRFAADVVNDPFFMATGGLKALGNAVETARYGKPGSAINPEVLPAEAPPIRRALPAVGETSPVNTNRVSNNPAIEVRSVRDPYRASSTGNVQRESLLNPVGEARLAGIDFEPDMTPAGKPTPVTSGTVLDTGELAEKRRQGNLYYTQHELHGGTSLEVPDSERYLRGTELGINEVPRDSGSLPFPTNMAPAAVRPRIQQEVQRALAPRQMQEPYMPGAPEPLEPAAPRLVDIPVAPNKPDLMGGTAAIKPGEPLLPSAVRELKKDTGLDAEAGVKAIDESPAPPVVKQQMKEKLDRFTKTAAQPSYLLKSIYAQLGELGDAGKELVQRFQRAYQNRAEYDAAWTEHLFPVGNKLKSNEFQNFGAYVEGRMEVPNERVQHAVDEWKKYQTMMGNTATTEGLHLKRGGDVIPFEKRGGDYWPHFPSEPLTKDSIVQRLVDNGMSRYDAVRVAKGWENTGEIFVGAQHSRLEKIFNYRDDFDVAIAHGRSMSKRIANHINLGPKDIAGKGSDGIANLIEDTGSGDLAMKLASRLAGRDGVPNAALVSGLNNTRKLMSITSLPNFGIKNVLLGQAQNMYMAALSRHPIAAVKEVTQLFKQTYRDDVMASGALNSFAKSLAEEMGGSKDWFGIKAGESINRMVAAAIGKSTIRAAIADYQAGRNVQSAKYFIETLLARNADTVTELTPELEKFAAGRMAEITQGLNNPGNLPYHWSNPVNTYGRVAGQLALIFKKVGFQTTRTVKDSIKADPKLAIPLWLGITQVAGEMVGDTTSAITGKERPEEIANRIADNWGNAFMGGLVWELATSAQYGPTALIGAAAGPVASKASELGYDISQTGGNLMNEKEDPFKPLRTFGEKNLPVPGRERLRSIFEGQ